MTARTPRLTLLFRSVALLLLATACKVSLNQPATPQAPSLEAANEFVVTPLAASATPARVRVSATYRNLSSAPTVDLVLPDRHSFVQVEPRWHTAPQAFDMQGQSLAMESVEPWRLRVSKGAATTIRVELDVRLDHREQAAVVGRDEYEHPGVCEDGSLILFGSALFPLPETLPQDQPLSARVSIRDERPVLSTWPRADDGAWTPMDPWALQSDALLIGNFATSQVQIEGSTVRCAFAAGNERVQAIIAPLIERIVREQCQRMQRPPSGDWLFVFNPPLPAEAGSQSRSLAGSPKRTTMTLAVSGVFDDDSLRTDLAHLMAHEYHHTFATARGPGFQGDLRFVGEGFTDWYGWQSARLAGAVTPARWNKVLSEKLAEDLQLRERARLSLAEAGGMAFYMDRVAYQQVYTCGFVLAAVLALELQQAQHAGLDAFYRQLLDEPPQDLDAFLARLEGATSASTRAWFERAVRSTEPTDVLARLRELGVTTDLATLPPQLRANLEVVRAADERPSVRVIDLDPADLAAIHGLAAGDFIETVGGVRVDSVEALRREWAKERGDVLELTCRRGTQSYSIVMPAPPKVRSVTIDATRFLVL